MEDIQRNAQRKFDEAQKSQSSYISPQTPLFNHFKFLNFKTNEEKKKALNYLTAGILGLVFIKIAFGGFGGGRGNP